MKHEPLDSFGGIDPPSYRPVYEPVPCKCGIKHAEGDGNYEPHYIKMTTDDSPWQLPPMQVCRCKHCKELLVKRIVYERP